MMHAPKVLRVPGGTDMLDQAECSDLLIRLGRRDVAPVGTRDARAGGKPGAFRRVGGPRRLCRRQRHAMRIDAPSLRRPEDEGAPAAAEVEEALAGHQRELTTHQLELVLLRGG